MKNECEFIGRLTRDPELRNTQNGGAVANLSIACEEKWKDKSGQEQSKTTYPKFVSFGSQAGLISKSLVKGDLVSITGRYAVSTWENKEGAKQYDHHFVISRIFRTEFLKAEPLNTMSNLPHDTSFTSQDIPF